MGNHRNKCINDIIETSATMTVKNQWFRFLFFFCFKWAMILKLFTISYYFHIRVHFFSLPNLCQTCDGGADLSSGKEPFYLNGSNLKVSGVQHLVSMTSDNIPLFRSHFKLEIPSSTQPMFPPLVSHVTSGCLVCMCWPTTKNCKPTNI